MSINKGNQKGHNTLSHSYIYKHNEDDQINLYSEYIKKQKRMEPIITKILY